MDGKVTPSYPNTLQGWGILGIVLLFSIVAIPLFIYIEKVVSIDIPEIIPYLFVIGPLVISITIAIITAITCIFLLLEEFDHVKINQWRARTPASVAVEDDNDDKLSE